MNKFGSGSPFQSNYFQIWSLALAMSPPWKGQEIYCFPLAFVCLSVTKSCQLYKNKDTEALFNIAYNVTDITSQSILRHNNIFNRYLPALQYLPRPTPLYASVSKGAASTILTPLVWCGHGIRTHDLTLRKQTFYQMSYQGYNLITARDILTKHHMFIKHIQTTCHAKEP